jgi:hypothetical protein
MGPRWGSRFGSLEGGWVFGSVGLDGEVVVGVGSGILAGCISPDCCI